MGATTVGLGATDSASNFRVEVLWISKVMAWSRRTAVRKKSKVTGRNHISARSEQDPMQTFKSLECPIKPRKAAMVESFWSSWRLRLWRSMLTRKTQLLLVNLIGGPSGLKRVHNFLVFFTSNVYIKTQYFHVVMANSESSLHGNRDSVYHPLHIL